MFYSKAHRIAQHLADLIDDMLLGDYHYIFDGDRLYADVDYYREHPHHSAVISWTPSGGRGSGPQRHILAGPTERRPGTICARTVACDAPSRKSAASASTFAARHRASH